MKCRDCDTDLTRTIDRRRGLCTRCYHDELRQQRFFDVPPSETIEGKQRLLMEEGSALHFR